MKRAWPAEFDAVFDDAEEVMIEPVPTADGGVPHEGAAVQRKALRVRLPLEEYQRIWPLAEMRFRPGGGRFAGKAVTLITTNPHYHPWHPADGGSVEGVADSGRHYKTDYVVVHFLLDDVRETSPA